MQITLPLVVPLKADFTNPKRFLFRSDNVGSYNVDMAQFQRQILETFRDVQVKGWTIQTVTPIQGGVFDHQTKTGQNFQNSMWGWGYGWGTAATEGLLLILSRKLEDQIAGRFMEALPALGAYHQSRAKAISDTREQQAPLKERRHQLNSNTHPRPVRRAMLGLGRAEAYSFLDQEYASEAEALAAKAATIAQIDEELRRLQNAEHVQITQFLRPDQLATLQAVMPDGTLHGQIIDQFANWTLPPQ